jgi:hypothetical protein
MAHFALDGHTPDDMAFWAGDALTEAHQSPGPFRGEPKKKFLRGWKVIDFAPPSESPHALKRERPRTKISAAGIAPANRMTPGAIASPTLAETE